MPYIPPSTIHATGFPLSTGNDLDTANNLLREKYRAHYTPISYYTIKSNAVSQANENIVAGESGQTAYDPLYMESVDKDLRGLTWVQPHQSGTYTADADDSDQFDAAKTVHARVVREAKNLELGRLGFDKFRDLVLYIPCIILDGLAITVKQGDKFLWGGNAYTVVQQTTDGYWKNSNVALFVVVNAESRRRGS